MRILFTATRYHPNQHFWVKTLQENGHQVRFFALFKSEENEFYDALEPEIVPHRKLPHPVCQFFDWFMRLRGDTARRQFHYWPDKAWLQDKIQVFKPDIIIVRDLVFPLSIATFSTAKKLGVRAVLYNQYPLEKAENFTTRLFQFLRIAPRFRITPTRKTDAVHNQKTNTYYIPLVTGHVFDIKNKKYLENRTLQILTVAKLHLPRKQLRLLIEAIAILKKQNIRVNLTLAGSLTDDTNEEYQQLLQLIQREDLEAQVEIHVNIPYTEIISLYEKHDLFVLPSIKEPFSISPIGAINYGLPVILTTDNGASSCIKKSENGILINGEDAHELADAIVTINNAEQLQRMGKASHQHWKEQYSPATFMYFFNQTFVE